MTDTLPEFSSEDLSKQAAAPKTTKPRKPRTQTKAMGPEAPKDEKRYDITLHDNDGIPPSGQFISVNGYGYLLKPGERASVPASVLEVLDNAIQGIPNIENGRVAGIRQSPRLPYTLHRD